MNSKKLPSLIILIILTSITILFWVSFNIYQAFTTNATPIVPEEILLQIDPKLDTKTIELIKNRN